MSSIIFFDDWKKYPDAICDTSTTNKSFLHYAATLRDMGIRNHHFCLALHNRALVGVDPHDPNITKIQMLAIAQECKINFWYFLREVARVPGGSSNDPIRFKANRANISLYWLYFNHIFNILIQPRQTGKSYGADTLAIWLMHIRKKKTYINLLTKDDQLRSKNLERLKNIDLELPFYLNQRKNSDVANGEQIKISSLSNTYTGFVPNLSPKLAQKIGRGHTADTFFIDEGPYIANIAITLSAMLAAGNAARKTAMERNEPYGTVMTTTVGDLMEEEGEYVYKLCQNAAEFTEKFFDCTNLPELRDLIRKQNRAIKDGKKATIRVYSEFNHRQLGFTDEWLIEAMDEATAEGEDAAKDYLNKWKFGETSSALNKQEKDSVNDSMCDPKYIEIIKPYGYMFRWYVDEKAIESLVNRPIIIGLDTSDAAGGNGDGIGLVGTCPYSGEVVYAFDINETTIPAYVQWLFRFMMKFPKTVLIPERRSTGSSIIDMLLDMFVSAGVNPFKRIYNLAVQQANEREAVFRLASKMYGVDADLVFSNKRLFGFATSGTGIASRTELYSTTFKHCLKYCGNTFKDKRLANQTMALIVDKNNRVDHRKGHHDDLVIAKLLTHFLLTSGKNLDFYGIDYTIVLKDSIVAKMEKESVNVRATRMQDEVVKKIDFLMAVLAKEKDTYMRLRIERELKIVYDKLPEQVKAAKSYDDMINQLNNSRRIDNIKRR